MYETQTERLFILIYQNKCIISSIWEFSQEVINCVAQWGKKSADCNGDAECLQTCSKDLRACLDAAFPDSRTIEFESDKINYILSSIFFLINRIFKVLNDIKHTSDMKLDKKQNREDYDAMKEHLDEIIAKYYW